MKITILLSYDLGIKGDYPSLYKWLDNHKAKECGDSIARFQFDVKDKTNLYEEIKESLKESVTFNLYDRVYIALNKDGKMTGKFIIGKRKPGPWEGYGDDSQDEADDE